MKSIKIVVGSLIAAWFVGILIFYFSIYPLRLGTFFAGFFDQFGIYEGFNASYIVDIIFLLLTLWFALLIGYFISQVVRIRFASFLELSVISTGLGLFVLGMLVFIAGITGKLYNWLFQLFYLGGAPLLALLIAGTPYRNEIVRHLQCGEYKQVSRQHKYIRWICIVIICLVLIVGLLYTFTPPTQSDGLRYHLAAPQEYIKHHGIIYIPFNAFSNFPFLVEMLFTLGMLLHGDILSKLFHFSFLVLSGVLLATFWRHVFRPELRSLFNKAMVEKPEEQKSTPEKVIPGRWLVMLVFFSTPAIAIVGCWEFIDLGVAFYFLALIYTLILWCKSDKAGWLILAGVFGGACLGTKYTMVVFIAAAVVWILLLKSVRAASGTSIVSRIRGAIKPLAIFLAIAIILGAPWYLKNTIFTGNPVYPFAHEIFEGGEWTDGTAKFYSAKAAEKGQPLSPATFITIPWDTAVYWADFESFNPGIMYLAFFPLVVVLAFILFFKTRKDTLTGIKTVIFFAFIYHLLWYFTYQSNRFMIPCYALCSLLIVAVVIKIGFFWRPLRWVAIITLIVASLYGSLWTVRWILTEARPRPLPVVLGFDSREEYLMKALNYYPCAQWFNLKAEFGTKVLFVGEHRGYYFRTIDYLASDWFDVPYVIHLIRETDNNDALFRLLEKIDVEYVFINQAEIALYYERYFKPRFNERSLERLNDFINSPRLKRIFPPGTSRTYICRIVGEG